MRSVLGKLRPLARILRNVQRLDHMLATLPVLEIAFYGSQHDPFCTVLLEQVSESVGISKGQLAHHTRRPDKTGPDRDRVCPVIRAAQKKRLSMKKVMFALAMLSLGTLCWAGSAREDATDRLNNATSVMHEVMGMPDKGIPEEVLEHAKCVAVIPHMVKGGFVFGAEGGKGVATCRTANGWSAPAFITISGGSWGLQIGVEAVDVVMIFQNHKAMQRLLSSNFQVGGDASAAAGPVGRHATAGTDWKLDTEILTYSRAKGAFAGLTLTGASLRQDNDSRHAIYGPKVTTQALLLGKVPVPAVAKPFVAEISHAKAEAKADK